MRKILLALCGAAALCLVAATGMAEPRPEVPAAPLEFKGAKKTVMFGHEEHKEYDCAMCHHPVNGVETYEKCATAGCHDDLEGKKSPALYAIVHTRKDLKFRTCMSCHLEKAAEQPEKKKELTGCKGSYCHVN